MRPFLPPPPALSFPYATLFYPLAYLAILGAYAKVSIDADGERYITLDFKRGIKSKVQLQAKAIAKSSIRPVLRETQRIFMICRGLVKVCKQGIKSQTIG